MAHHQMTITTDVVPLHVATVPEVTENALLAADHHHDTTNTTTEVTHEEVPQETTVHHHQEDTMIHMMPEVPRLLLDPTTPTFVVIPMHDPEVHLQPVAMAVMEAAAVVVGLAGIEVMRSDHIRYACLMLVLEFLNSHHYQENGKQHDNLKWHKTGGYDRDVFEVRSSGLDINIKREDS